MRVNLASISWQKAHDVFLDAPGFALLILSLSMGGEHKCNLPIKCQTQIHAADKLSASFYRSLR